MGHEGCFTQAMGRAVIPVSTGKVGRGIPTYPTKCGPNGSQSQQPQAGDIGEVRFVARQEGVPVLDGGGGYPEVVQAMA